MKRVVVGNDVVDLENPRTEGRATDERFVGRIFDLHEQEAIASSDDADTELWSRWAAKEAGFKVVSKLMGAPPPFVHRSFVVSWTGAASAGERGTALRDGTVRHGEHTVHVSVKRHAGGMHAVAYGSSGADPDSVHLESRVAMLEDPEVGEGDALEDLAARLTDRELEAVYSRESAAVRLGARADLAELLRVDQGRLEIVCAPGPAGRRPPQVLLDGHQAPADVSLSHDGRLIAWVLWVEPETGEGG